MNLDTILCRENDYGLWEPLVSYLLIYSLLTAKVHCSNFVVLLLEQIFVVTLGISSHYTDVLRQVNTGFLRQTAVHKRQKSVSDRNRFIIHGPMENIPWNLAYILFVKSRMGGEL
jgi:hypothetical protein